MLAALDQLRERGSLARYARLLAQVNSLEPSVRRLPDAQLSSRVRALKRKRRNGTDLLGLRSEMYALAREATRRAIGIRQFDEQVVAAIALCEQNVIQMDTGEGKTFVAPMAACLYALDGQGVHVLTANDYLVERDARMLQPVYALLGFRAGHVLCDSPLQERRTAYRADVTYVTVTALGHGFLREYMLQEPESLRRTNMWQYLRSEIDGLDREQRCLRGRHVAIIDEVDSVLIDYARRPVSISRPSEHARDPETYAVARGFALGRLENPLDFTLDNVRRRAELTDHGKDKIGELIEKHGYLHLMESEWEERIQEALTAEHLMHKGRDYVVRDAGIELVDQVSGRLMVGQRLGGELHQALEAKENVPMQPRQVVVKKVTIQSLIRSYRNLAGMTATAWEDRKEFRGIYDMKTTRFAPREPLQMERGPDVFFRGSDDRWRAVSQDVAKNSRQGRPVLVGTWSVENSQRLSGLLRGLGIPHDMLNAVDHKNEASIIAHAGEKGKVTVAANMAGRGVEIPLGDGVEALGGLYVIGAERHVLARFDGQLAGRCARRGKPGKAQFYVSLEDDVFRILSPSRLARVQRRFRRMGRAPFTSRRLARIVRECQEEFRRKYAWQRRMLLVRDLAVEKADQILFGQDRL